MKNMQESMMILVAGPYRSGTGDDPSKMGENLRKLEEIALLLFRAGHIPVIGEWLALPLMEVAGSEKVGDSIYNEIAYPTAQRLLMHCNAVLRLPGESTGADEDIRIAKELGLPVYYNIEDIE